LIELRDYLDSAGRRPLRRWLDELDAVTRARVTKALVQLSLGNLSDVKSVGGGVLERRLDFGPGYRLYFGGDGDALQARDRMIRNRRTKPPPLAGSVRELIDDYIVSDPAFREALIEEAIETMLAGDVETGKTILRDYIKATEGFEKLGRALGTPPKSLIRMFGPRGNPQARNLFGVIGYLQKRDGLSLRVSSVRKKRPLRRAA
jgi:putative addiction module killer protein